YLALGREIDLHRIVAATERVPADIPAIGPARPDARREARVDWRSVLLFHVVAFAAVAPVQPAIRMQERAMHIRGVAGEIEVARDHLALVGDAVAIGVGELPDARW